MSETRDPRSIRLPAVHQVLATDAGRVAAARFGHEATVGAVRLALSRWRGVATAGGAAAPDPSAVAHEATVRLEAQNRPSVRRVFNLTGTVLHTNLGRAVWPEAAIAAATLAMRHAIALEFDLETGGRGERDDHVRGLVCELTGAEDACFVNNNAGAVLLVLNALSAGKDAIVSRGELIEIGGSFRLPDIMLRAGARLVEVGTTNRTHLHDYERAVGPGSGVILKAHTSNFVVQGFTAVAPATELAALARRHGVAFVHDLGSGALVDLGRYGLASEPTVRDALGEGADLVLFSGDKLLGGPQAGIIAGRKDLVRQVAKSPMKRALRLDKVRLAALEAVLKLYRDPDRLPETLPTLGAFVRPKAELAEAAERMRGAIAAAVGDGFAVQVVDCMSQVGSGALPLETLPSAGIAITPLVRKGGGTRLDALAAALRSLPIPVLGRIAEGALVLDLRCLDDEAGFAAQLAHLDISHGQGGPDALA